MTSTTKSGRSTTFKEKESDPGFLVAKGRFVSLFEKDLQSLLRSGVRTDDDRIITLKDKIDSERRDLEKKHVKELASAIFMAVMNHGYATIRCIGRNATYNACKAMAIARGNCYTKGVKLNFGPTFDEGNLGQLRNSSHVENVTALVFSVESFSDIKPDTENQE